MSLTLITKKGSSAKKSPEESPYLTAQRTWNNYIDGVVHARRWWQMVALASLLIVLAAVGGLYHMGTQSKFVPYIIEVDKLGRAQNIGPVEVAKDVNPRVMKSVMADFISNARLVTPDQNLQRKALFDVFAFIGSNDPSSKIMKEFYNTADLNPFKRSVRELVNVEISSVLPFSKDSWQVEWKETTRDRAGNLTKPIAQMRALMTVETRNYASNEGEDQLRRNPLGIFVTHFSWQEIQ